MNASTLAGCEGKTRLAFAAARRLAKAMRRRKGSIPVGAYHCPFCSAWHIGERAGRPRIKRPLPPVRRRG